MSRSRKLNPVIEMARKTTEDELIKLGETNALLQQEQGQLDDLINYRQDYLNRFRQGDPTLMSAKKALDLRAFLAQLDQAIQAQQNQVTQSETRVQHQQKNWMEAKNKEQAIDTLMERYKSDELHQQQRHEQRENDEHTNAMWLRRHKS
ncbi:flagellar export protein FliJ [Methylophaga sp.]|uniref:flagellar export protein FliJ n=1 Tax=Methylophaga sp. TaxID=2024840 RepID=UPI003F69ABA9